MTIFLHHEHNQKYIKFVNVKFGECFSNVLGMTRTEIQGDN